MRLYKNKIHFLEAPITYQGGKKRIAEKIVDIIEFEEGGYFKNVQGYWVDWYEEGGTIDASTLFNEITRFEYISKNGREIVEHGKFEFQLQDGEQTLKVFKL